jgi:excisionase family DNA binding protein
MAGRSLFAWENPGRGAFIVRTIRGQVYKRHLGRNGLLTVYEASLALGCHRATLYRMIEAGEIKTVTVEARLLVPLSEIRRAMDQRR